jgi:hypothetical protein
VARAHCRRRPAHPCTGQRWPARSRCHHGR